MIEAALGPRASLHSIELGLRSVDLQGLVIRGDGARGPSEFQLRAKRVRVTPELASLWQRGAWRIGRLRAKVERRHLNAPGQAVIAGLMLDGGGTLSGIARQALIGAMALDFILEGRLDDPPFSLNELFAARLAVGLAEKLGVSIGGVAEGVGNVVTGLFGR